MDQRKLSIDLYPLSRTPALDPEVFRNPPAQYRGAPFWSWNCRLERDMLLRQIDCMRAMGFGGFHMHPRTGMATPYMSEEYLQLVRACAGKAKADEMIAYLYDEDRWPSGFAGGLVTRDERYRMRYLVFTPTRAETAGQGAGGQRPSDDARGDNPRLLGRYAVVLENGRLADYWRLGEGDVPWPNARLWYAYVETARPSSWHNNQTYVDTLSREAIRQFIKVTHEPYARAVGEYFGTVVPSIFTDEPQFRMQRMLPGADAVRDLFIPFTDDLPATYKSTFGDDLLDHLPELFWELPAGRVSPVRYRFIDHVTERFASAFADTVGAWCAEHGIALTGHMMSEENLGSQTAFIGEAMRHYRGFGIPGIDLLCDNREYNTPKQAQSAAHQLGRTGVLSELYGVTNWDFDFVGHKAQGDWQAALGITLRVPHLSWVSMAGEAKRDYPASILHQSPWHLEYPLVENHFARVNTALTRGRPVVRIGVIHPIESFWLAFGPLDQTKMERQELEQRFEDLANWLLFGLLDFDFIAESMLPELGRGVEGKRLVVGEMAYDVILVPGLRTMRSTTLDRLEAFAAAGGQVIFLGEPPTLVDAQPSDRALKLAARSTRLEFARTRIIEALAPRAEIEVRLAEGGPADSLLYQLRADGDNRYLFLCNTDRQRGRRTSIRIRGDWAIALLDTLTGDTRALPARREGGFTALDHHFTAHGSLLLALSATTGTQLVARSEAADPALTALHWRDHGRLADLVPVTLSEPNVLLLDQAEWRLDQGEWQDLEEVLRIGVAVRERLRLPRRDGGLAQPWTDDQPAPTAGVVSLRFTIHSEVDVKEPLLGVEAPEDMRITWDGEVVEAAPVGWYIDECIKTLRLPAFSHGMHELVLEIPFTRKTDLEWCYLLGDFGVRAEGRRARITAPVRTLAFGDWTCQGLPFYGGNVTYHCVVEAIDEELAIDVPHFRAPLLSADVDGRSAGKIAFAPFRLELGRLNQGAHELDLTAYGNRVNTLGALHNCDAGLRWHGPQAWRSTGAAWAYEYQLRKAGILVAPAVLRKGR